MRNQKTSEFSKNLKLEKYNIEQESKIKKYLDEGVNEIINANHDDGWEKAKGDCSPGLSKEEMIAQKASYWREVTEDILRSCFYLDWEMQQA